MTAFHNNIWRKLQASSLQRFRRPNTKLNLMIQIPRHSEVHLLTDRYADKVVAHIPLHERTSMILSKR